MRIKFTTREISLSISLIYVLCATAINAQTVVPVGASQTYKTIQSAYSTAIPATLTGAYVIELQSDYSPASETFPITLGAKSGTSVANTITVKPSAGVNVTISSAAVSSGVLNKTIIFDGASYVSIDGISRTGNTGITIQNPNTESAHTIVFTNGANNNSVRNCFIKGASVTKGTATENNSVIYFDTQANINNVIEYNDICNIEGLANPVTMILLNNTGASSSDYNTIQNNNIYNYNYITGTTNGTAAAVQVSGASANARILNNRIYWSGTIADTKSALYGILLDATSVGAECRVEGNTIGGTDSNNSGIASFNLTGEIRGISVNLNTTVKNNTVKNIAISTTSPNTYMIAVSPNGTALSDVDAWTGNTVANVDMLYLIGSTTVNLYCIYLNPKADTPSRNISFNTIYGCSILSTPKVTTILRAIYVNTTVPTALWSYVGNKLYDLTCKETDETSTNGIVGIDTRANTAVIEKNLLYNFKTNNTVSMQTVLHGIRLTGNNASGTTIKNNVVSIGNGVTGSSQIRGIVHSGSGTAGQTVNVFNNTVYVGGSQANAAVNYNAISAAFYRDGSIIANLTLKNNIFVNARTTTQSGETMSAIQGAVTIADITSSDYNILIAPVCVRIHQPSLNYATLADWRTITSSAKDMHSSNVDPGFVDATAAIPDLHIASVSSSANQAGIAIDGLTDDFEGNLRANFTPVDLGAYSISEITSIKPENNASCSVVSANGSLLFKNMSGQNVSLYNISGNMIKQISIPSDNYLMKAGKGLVLVKSNNVTKKVLVY